MNEIKFNPAIHPTYKQQFDKLTDSYIKGEVEPYVTCACFVGNLLNKNEDWADIRDYWGPTEPIIYEQSAILAIKRESNDLYSPSEIIHMEGIFMDIYTQNEGSDAEINTINEDALFMAFEKTLDLLKSIHESKGEIIDTIPEFKKRQLNETSSS